ncbi:Maf family protein [Echinimonas agarilytica]|uniref:7-methyl-GTP pyrophosphatase n=1 Tax=Echinimonas agarilytica TaxID=1215918 RepID=A0AA41W6M3_9GAMM|nr:nucleoside triphosphate pyrophosphatase [Echinimonas agarilytica]MCM2679850.1 Maf-like protein [Echinimonas agarilytica]
MTLPIVLGSTSPFRKAILEKLQIPFQCSAPNIDENAQPDENPKDLVARLAFEKATEVAKVHDSSLIIGSDQVAVVGNQILGKPHTHDNAVQQLQNSSGQVVTFLTGLCLYNSHNHTSETIVEPFEVHFKDLSTEEIENYLQLETPYKCAGSFKSEAAGIALFEKLSGDDPNTLIGLPLIQLIKMLKKQGLDVLSLARQS